MTDSKGRRARRGWLFFDAQCAFCTSLSRCAGRLLRPHGYAVAPLQDPRVQELLALPADQLLLEMRVLTPKGERIGGADALVFLAGEVWWGWPFFALAKLPGMMRLLRWAYRTVARHRRCQSAGCSRQEARLHPDRERQPKGGNSI